MPSNEAYHQSRGAVWRFSHVGPRVLESDVFGFNYTRNRTMTAHNYNVRTIATGGEGSTLRSGAPGLARRLWLPLGTEGVRM